MYSYKYKTRVDYSLTDAMGFMHHSNYARIYENARWEYFRHIGLPYAEIEKRGIWIPVISINLKYHKPAFYDDELEIELVIQELPRAKFPIDYKMTIKGELINSGTITLGFMKKGESQACRTPEFILDALSKDRIMEIV